MSVYMYAYTFIYARVWVYICTRIGAFCLFVLSNLSTTCACITGVSRAKWRMFKKCSHEIPLAERPEARLPYPTQTGGHQVCITRKGDSALQFVMNHGRETHLLCPSASPRGKPQTAVGQITWKYRAWQALGILSQFRGSPPSLLYPILSSATISSTWTTTNVSKTVIYLMNLLSTPALTPKETLYLPART